MRPFVSVIVPAYNETRYIEEQLEALRTQKYDGSWEIIVVNNRSTDNTVDVVEKYKNKIPNLHLVDAAVKQGRSYARNVGAQYAKGDVLLFCDAHAVAAPEWLSVMADALLEHAFVAGGMEVQKLNQSWAWNQPLPTGSTHKFMGFLPFAGSGNMGVWREAFEAVGGFCEEVAIGEDADLSFRLQLKGYAIYDALNAVMHVRYRKTIAGMWKQTIKFTEAHVYLYKKYAIHGYPRRGVKEAWPLYKWLMRYAPQLFVGPQQTRQKWIRTCAACWGRVRGSLKYRVFYL
jgi:glycosyltransferase involved in cell wall biosynthesis